MNQHHSTLLIRLLVLLSMGMPLLAQQGWYRQVNNTTSYLYWVHFPTPATGWVVGQAGTILKTTNGGANWTPQVSNTSNFLYSFGGNPTTTIRFSLPPAGITQVEERDGQPDKSVLAGAGSHVSLKVFDILGREVATLVDEEKPPGMHEVSWDGSGMARQANSGLASGIYFCKLSVGRFVQTRKLLLLR